MLYIREETSYQYVSVKITQNVGLTLEHRMRYQHSSVSDHNST